MKKITIANLNLMVDFIDKKFFDTRLQDYVNDSFNQPDMILKTVVVDNIVKPNGTVIDQISTATIVKMDENQYCRYIIDTKSEKIVCASYYNDNYSDVEIQFLKPKLFTEETLTMNEYIFTGFAFHNRLVEQGGTVLHGSGVAYNNQGIIFSANSGTGKSTHANLWKERFDNNLIIVNDDKPAIRFIDEVPYMFGTPWSGKTDLNTNVQVPIHAIVFIKQDSKNRMERLDINDSIYYLASQISRPYYDSKIGTKTLDVIERIIQSIPIYILHCNTNMEAVDVVYNKLVNERVLV